jgi:DNA mismatch endonuclease (patch repair protein)
VAVFVDGCLWHGCAEHCRVPQTHNEYWSAKIAGNMRRDRDTDRRLREAGWLPLRVWEHDDPEEAADRVKAAVVARRPS